MINKWYTVSIKMVMRLSSQKSEIFPDVSCFRNGITKWKHMMTGREKLVRILLLYRCFLDTDFVEDLSKCKKGKNENYNIPELVWSRPK